MSVRHFRGVNLWRVKYSVMKKTDVFDFNTKINAVFYEMKYKLKHYVMFKG